MDISREEQRILHLLAQGGKIVIQKDEKQNILEIECFTREGWLYPSVNLRLFRKLKHKKTIASSNGGPYRITRRGLELVRSQLNNR